ncbi:hypothetical protein SAMN05444487_11811 [Marininema mesophilum]|uniref:Uncharacterized protein n=1 Tax=Marininema mesophilum TaxID=1048340 RepID=A0A1H3BRR5_9BACL|nr:hypothetical protein [Marininema mesophilum]SDX44692.1 hypothetical protein SAMN05444487_11811 [Marininema mesophilum]
MVKDDGETKRTTITMPIELWNEVHRVMEEVKKDSYGAIDLSFSGFLRIALGDKLKEYKKTGKI